jgi:VHL beta domain
VVKNRSARRVLLVAGGVLAASLVISVSSGYCDIAGDGEAVGTIAEMVRRRPVIRTGAQYTFGTRRAKRARVETGSGEVTQILRSREGRVGTEVLFENELRGAVSVIWIDYEGREKLYTILAAGATYPQQSYSTHVWVFRVSPSGRLLGTAIVGERPLVVRLTADGVKVHEREPGVDGVAVVWILACGILVIIVALGIRFGKNYSQFEVARESGSEAVGQRAQPKRGNDLRAASVGDSAGGPGAGRRLFDEVESVSAERGEGVEEGDEEDSAGGEEDEGEEEDDEDEGGYEEDYEGDEDEEEDGGEYEKLEAIENAVAELKSREVEEWGVDEENDDDEPCPVCMGSGKCQNIHHKGFLFLIPQGVMDVPCPRCGTTGDPGKCSPCGGTGLRR